jgi:hypothetical protein
MARHIDRLGYNIVVWDYDPNSQVMNGTFAYPLRSNAEVRTAFGKEMKSFGWSLRRIHRLEWSDSRSRWEFSVTASELTDLEVLADADGAWFDGD